MSFSRQWEFPGGKIEPGEEPREALRREVREELCIDIEITDFLGRGFGCAGPGKVQMDIYAARMVGGEICLEEHGDHGWFRPEDLKLLDWVEPSGNMLLNVIAHMKRSPERLSEIGNGRFYPVRALMAASAVPTALTLMYTSAWFSMLSAEMAWMKSLFLRSSQ